ncbi:hypothetical protein AGR1B_pTi0066 [Agrobacterium fabacearum S56]|nr:hypothetical protein AGR1B_pTi0066 [Agrobacterium fabacearum S56]
MLVSSNAIRSRRSQITLSRAAVIVHGSLQGRVGRATSCRANVNVLFLFPYEKGVKAAKTYEYCSEH